MKQQKENTKAKKKSKKDLLHIPKTQEVAKGATRLKFLPVFITADFFIPTYIFADFNR